MNDLFRTKNGTWGDRGRFFGRDSHERLFKKQLEVSAFCFKQRIDRRILYRIISTGNVFAGDAAAIFGSFSSWVNDLYHISPGLPKIVSGLLVGGVVEEVMMRLFFMSLLALIISKLICKNEKDIPVKVFAAANIISALLFAAGHLPATMAMTTLTPVLLFRCFLFNGGLGLCFGWLYRKYGIGYAMIAHGAAHLISDLLMIIF